MGEPTGFPTENPTTSRPTFSPSERPTFSPTFSRLTFDPTFAPSTSTQTPCDKDCEESQDASGSKENSDSEDGEGFWWGKKAAIATKEAKIPFWPTQTLRISDRSLDVESGSLQFSLFVASMVAVSCLLF